MTKFYFKLFLLLGCIFAFNGYTFAQGSSNKGTDFWLGYGKHVSTGSMVLYITSDVNTTSTVTIPALGFTQTVTITANTVQFVDIPTTAHLNNDGLSANGIHVTSLKPVIVYAHIYQNSVSGATLVLPVNTLGKDYYSINYKQESNSANSVSWFFVVAVEDNTQVEITPSALTQGKWAANSVNTVSLKKGEIYNVLGTFNNTGNNSNGVDLTGSRIKSISSNGTCKKIAVFSGSSKIAINCLSYNFVGTTSPGSADNLFQQVYPTATWGKSFITVPHRDRNFVIYRVVKSDPTAVVTLNGAVIPAASFVNNFYYEFASQKVDEITSDKPIQLVQYAVTQGKTIGCTNGTGDVGDPEMIFLNPLEQTLTQITMYSTPRFNITKHFINVVIKNTGVASFKLDGANVANQFIAVPNNTIYSYAQFSVTAGTHNLSSDVGFNATAYGFGSADSYGYAAGANLTAFGIEPINSSSSLAVETGCVNTTYNLFVNLPYQAVDLLIDKGDGNGLKPVSPLTLISQTTKDGVTTYKYDLLPNLNFTKDSTYTFKVRAIKPTVDDCGTGDEFTFDFIINPLPVAQFDIPLNNCAKSPIQFAYKTNASQTITNYLWDFNGEATSTLEKPLFTFTTGGTKKVKLSVKSAEGCWSTILEKDVFVNQLPVPLFNTSTPVCEKNEIIFNDESTSQSGVINKWQWNFGDGASGVNNTSLIKNPTHTFNVAGTYAVKLITTTEFGCVDSVIKSVIVKPLPIVDFSNTSVCFAVGSTAFTNTTTIAGSEALTYLWNFDDLNSAANNSSTTKNPTHVYTAAGTYSVKLTVTSLSGCVFSTIKQVIVYPKPVANFTAPAQSCFNDDVNFTNTSVNTGITISEYLWDFNGVATSNLENPVYKFSNAGVKQIKLSIKTDKGCWSDVITKSIEVMQLPLANFNTAILKCEGSEFQFTDVSTTVGQTITEWTWDFGDATSTSNSSALQNPKHLFAKAGIYAVKLTVKTNLGCVGVKTIQVVVNPIPLTNFETPDICLDDASALFTNTTTIADNTTLTYLWNFGDPSSGVNNSSTLRNPNHKYLQAKVYDVTLTVTSINSCVTSITKKFTVNGSTPKANFLVQNSGLLCSDNAVKFEDIATVDFGEITKIEWTYDTSNPTIIETDNSPNSRTAGSKIYSHAYPVFYTPALKTVTVKMKTYSGITCAAEITKTITLKAIPRAEFTMPNGCLQNGEATFTNLSTFNNLETGLAYSWDFGDTENNTSGQKNPTHLFKKAQTYTITLLVTAANGCETIVKKSFVVKGAIVNTNFIIQNSNGLCVNNKVVFTDDAKLAFGEISNLEWFFDFDNQPNNNAYKLIDTSPALRNANARTYEFSYPIFNSPLTKAINVKLKSITGDNCVSEIIKTITLKAVPNVIFTTIPSICAEVDNYQITQGRETTGFIGTGEFSGKGVSKAGLFTPIVAGVGTHIITYTFTGANGCVDSKTSTITVFETPTAFAGEDKTILIGGIVVLEAKATGKNVSYKWTPSTGLDRDDILQPTANPLKDIIYTLIVKSDEGCTKIDEVFVKVLQYPEIPNTFTPNGDGVNDTWDIKYLESYPDITITVFDRNGKEVFKTIKYKSGWDGKNNNVDLPVGVYYYIVTAKAGELKYTGSVVIIR